jgi:hypothetical protein
LGGSPKLAFEERMLPLIFDNSSDRRISQFVYAEANHPSSEMRIVSPTERSENAAAFSWLAEEDLRFSMKTMFAAGFWNYAEPV